MIGKLRNRFLALVMFISSVILIGAFVSIYLITYIRTNAHNMEKLTFREEVFATNIGEVIVGDSISETIVLNRIFPDNGIYFNLIVNENADLILIDSALQLTEDTYQYAASMAFTNSKKTIEFEGRKWQYSVTSDNIILEGFSLCDSPLYCIRFLDVTDSLNMLSTLLYTLFFIGVLLLIVFYFLSRLFADRAMQPLMEAWEKQRQFVADASHELKTPLSIINANISVLYENKNETIESQLKWINYIESGTKRMSLLINHLLSLAKIEDYSTRPDKIELNVSELIGDVIEDINTQAIAKKITIEEKLPLDILMFTDYRMLRQVVDILLDNAIKYTPENGNVTVILRQNKTNILIQVQNSGAGIEQSDLPKIFDRFYRADQARSSHNESYGLGLFIAKSIMKKLGGKITVESIPNETTLFTLNFHLK